MHRILFAGGALLLAGFSPAQAQEGAPADSLPPAGWQKAADLGLNLTQSGYSDSWEGSESGSITWTVTGNTSAENQIHPKVHWRNNLKLLYGETHRQVADPATSGRIWQSPEKSTDRIFLESLMNLTLGAFVDPYAAFTVESQFYSEYGSPKLKSSTGADSLINDTIERRFLSPLKLTESAGVGKQIIQEEQHKLFSRLGFALRQDFLQIPTAGDPGVWDLESQTVKDGGLEWVTDYEKVFGAQRMKIVSKLRVFQALFSSAKDDLAADEFPDNDDSWQATDIGFENTLSASLTKYLQMTFFVEWLYDQQIIDRGRFRETLGLGLTYKLF